MFKEGPLFTLATLQDYASGKFDLKTVLKKTFVDDDDACDFLDEMREMVEHMLCLDSSSRDDAATYVVVFECNLYVRSIYSRISTNAQTQVHETLRFSKLLSVSVHTVYKDISRITREESVLVML
jgi:hypothetical protein